MALSVGNLANNPAAESAASVAYADSYHSARGNAAWANIDGTVKEQLLRKGGDYLRVIYGGYWNSDTLASAAAPIAMQMANAELALIAKDGPLISNQSRGKKKVKVGPLEIEYDGNSPTQKEFVYAARLVASLLTNGGVVSNSLSSKVIRC